VSSKEQIPIPVLIMLPPAGGSQAEEWMASARRAAALDLLDMLSGLQDIGEAYVLAANTADREALAAVGASPVDEPPPPFHFGQVLASFVIERGMDRLAYFGGASAPLLSKEMITDACNQIAPTAAPAAAVNNLHSTDWVILNHAQTLAEIAPRLPKDNSLGWVLEREAGFTVHSQAPSAATRADIDTPTDLLLMAGHPHLGPNLQSFLEQAPQELLERVGRLRQILDTPGCTLSVIGRSASAMWSQLERKTQIWVRLFVEERGMVASGRLEHGMVRSLVAQALEDAGPRAFIRQLELLSDAVLWDTRVWMAHRGSWPSAADRYAADLGWASQVRDRAIRRLTQEINRASIPILTGGHGVVSGSAYALLETMLD
jgi:hypothetical protein